MLCLSTRWGFASLRKLALKSIEPPTPHDQLVLARTYAVDHWVLPALTALCQRTLPLSLDEAQEMNMEDVILVATVREEIRGGVLRVDVADIPCHVVKAVAEAQPEKIEAEIMAKAELENEVKAAAREKLEAEGKAEADGIVTDKVKVKAGEEAKAAEAKAELEAKKESPREIALVAASSVLTEGSRTELVPLAGTPMKHLSAASSTPQGSAPIMTHLATSITVAPSLASAVCQRPERKLTRDKQDGKRSWLTM